MSEHELAGRPIHDDQLAQRARQVSGWTLEAMRELQYRNWSESAPNDGIIAALRRTCDHLEFAATTLAGDAPPSKRNLREAVASIAIGSLAVTATLAVAARPISPIVLALASGLGIIAADILQRAVNGLLNRRDVTRLATSPDTPPEHAIAPATVQRTRRALAELLDAMGQSTNPKHQTATEQIRMADAWLTEAFGAAPGT